MIQLKRAAEEEKDFTVIHKSETVRKNRRGESAAQ